MTEGAQAPPDGATLDGFPLPGGAPRTKGRRSRSGRSRRGSVGRWLGRAGLALTCLVLAGAPLAAGGVHRASLISIFLLSALALALHGAGVLLEGRGLRVAAVAVVPLVFLLIPAAQSLPLPHAARAALDREGTALRDESPVAGQGAAPLSLSPSGTRAHVGRAGAALAMFLLAFHLASGQRRRHLLPRVIALAGIAAVVIGLGHRIFGVGKIYGLYATTEALLRGPFVNKNHNAEFLELATFACLACSLQRSTALNRVGWMVGALFCAAGAVGTLSRGAVLGLGAGVLAFLLFGSKASSSTTGPGERRLSWAWSALAVGLVVVVAAALGAGQLVDRFQRGAVTGDVRFQLWSDSLRVLAAHPLGIGRGAFGDVYPVYRTLLLPIPIRFTFVESHPLQLLVDGGWVAFAALAAGMAFLAWTMVRQGRRDRIEAALLAALLAVLAHSLVDFGLETPGVLLPFVALLGVLLGRSRAAEAGLLPRARSWLLVGAGAAGALFGVGAVAHASYDDFDALVRTAPTVERRREVLARAQRAHPIDYFHALTFARTEPLRPGADGVSPRLHALNWALRLCPSCELVHMEVARNLWALSLRSQALVEWRTVIRLQPSFFGTALRELTQLGARPEELAAIATSDPRLMIEVADFLIASNRIDPALKVLDQADALGPPRADSLLVRAQAQMRMGQLDATRATVNKLHALGVQDPRLVILDAAILTSVRAEAGVEAALGILDAGAARYPSDVPLQRFRVDFVMQHQKWQAAARAVDGLKMALYATQAAAGEAHVAAARVQGRMGRWTHAIGEYRIALADNPGDVALWIELGRAAESAGRDATAREAYAEAARLAPANPDSRAGLQRLEGRLSRLRDATTSGSSATGAAQP